jgi:hypothetical protein
VKITVAYALPDRQTLEEVVVPKGATVADAIARSHVLEQHPEINLKVNKVGIFGKLVKMDTVLRDGDRVEIYRPLPKPVRDPYAAEQREMGSGSA